MTVCIAAICGEMPQAPSWPMVIAVSDRLYTVGDHWKYEPAYTKHNSFGHYAFAMVSGDISECDSILRDTHAMIGASVPRDTKYVAECLASAFATYRRAEAERGLLIPIGLDLSSLTHDASIQGGTVDRLINDLRRWRLEDSFIVGGIDAGGHAQIFSVEDPGWASSASATGFVAVGSGADHATALFLRQGYVRRWNPARAILLAYSAKKLAEVDPYVGPETDVWVMGPGDLPFAPLHEDLRKSLEDVYSESRRTEVETTGALYERYENDVVKFLEAKQQARAEPEGNLLEEKGSGQTPGETEPAAEQEGPQGAS